MTEFRHRTDIPAMKELYDKFCTQIKALSGEAGVSLTKDDKIKISAVIRESLENFFNCFIAISEKLHDYKDREIDQSLQEIKTRDNTPIDLSKE